MVLIIFLTLMLLALHLTSNASERLAWWWRRREVERLDRRLREWYETHAPTHRRHR